MPQPPPPTLPPGARAAAAWSAVVLLVGGAAALVITVGVVLHAAVVPVLLALLVTALLEPVHRLLRRLGLPAGIAAGLTSAVLVAVAGGAVWVLVTVLSGASGEITDALGQAAERIGGDGPIASAVHGAADGLRDLGKSAAGAVAKGVLSGLGLAAQLLAGAVLTLALAFFMLRDRGRAVAAVRALAPAGHGDLAVRMALRAYRAMGGFMRGTTVIAAIDATLIAVGLLLLDVPNAMALGALVFIGAYLPYVGAFLTGAVAVLVAFADGGVGKALAALAVVLGVQLLEGSVLQPVVQGHAVAMHPALVMLAITAGAAVGGLLGTLLSVPLAAAASGVFAELRDRTRPVRSPRGTTPAGPQRPAAPPR
ncbi:AI-2E family transporter [Streptomyces sp. A7024]|uniref:AI-2E family transporter n=1 Tax=Streptomyces coryli TaxID=1128680 RepID=A0A6G4UEP8_9ACTN|nr:AI-2E family transporter [Streptomyces coryli]NGN69911.1 AI-2E family transporter [Streptomyces coryli]